MKDARYHAFCILKEFDRSNDRLKFVRDKYYKKTKLEQNDLSRTLVLTNEVVRWEARLDYWISSFLSKPIKKLHPSIHIILRLGYYEAVMDDQIPAHAAVHSWVELTKKEMGRKFSGLVNAVMRKTEKIDPNQMGKKQSQSQWYSYPQWMFEKWNNQIGREKTIQLCDYFNEPSKIDFRLNCNPESKAEIINQINELGIAFESSPESEKFIRVESGSGSMLKSDLFKNGILNVQDRASGAVVELLDPQSGETILDVCAAPGTKSGYIVELMNNKGQLFSSDISQKRIEFARERAKELKMPIEWSFKDATIDEFPMADRILIDAPCTGTGVLGRRPDIRWRREKYDVDSMAEIQSAILNHMVQFLKPEGVMVYATCSLEPEENWNVVESFLKLNNNFSLESGEYFIPKNWLNDHSCLETFPPNDLVDGMFAARFRKI
ncbi:MAG: 16S rRNA (cytosine(967)-C(5))-methyltransferase RsmB [Candidatus Marinimicrobia bacterium]|jgi:16S rRNA (cytosine967-C5)-methyltransferase|nr:16S rRNA (cytosine(967)-C(5))-methyltransferase RsmB [Candidatus Neomarinimicrobiota bacterium]MBT3676672.1 16S rRNA (cytosine(967)-C(5))-methyltransferase RsmB [Candidatus Neomarinimicrobiota bacterium]MBT3764037.1 16S rRNA (cytosine(967)-C(5))-methyltransferase RsmB [Candidatus Neomarinimicrobiota bacterium]MBT4068398.1 16S rRNA (cytosine(967)-C(5))-methyltransferase RsmB [Candidatus Neomarinimicrobiota bacterium]MBT4372472.1 16S rRNA (cytosine(967)-C(5))-methyltransferase RsmB [Candidatus